jgi:hypothetical protein
MRVRLPPSVRLASLAQSAARLPCKQEVPVRVREEALNGDSANGRPRGFGPRNVGSTPASPALACLVITAACILGTDAVGVRFSEQARCGCSSIGRALRCQRRGSRIVTGQPLTCPSRPIGRVAWPRPRRFRVRIPGWAPWRVNQSGNWASLLTSARVTPWDSSSPLSAWEDEAARARSPSGKRVGVREGSVDRVHRLPLWRVNRAGVPAPPRKRMGARKCAGAQDLRSPLLEGAPPARQRALKTRAGVNAPGRSTLPPSAGHDPAG